MEKTLNGSDRTTPAIKKASWKSSIAKGILVLVGILIFAYGFKVTKVSFDQISSPSRQESLTRVLRAIAKPDVLEYEQIETTIDLGVYVPCQAGTSSPAPADMAQPYLVMSPPCADPRSEVTLEGHNFEPFASGPVFFVPQSEVQLRMGVFESDSQGYFKLEAKLPPRADTQIQKIRAITRVNIGSPHLTQTARETWDKIIETVFLALLATAFGILLAVPVSFFAAQNLMREITSPMSSLALSVLGWPTGMFAGVLVARWIRSQSAPLTTNIWSTLAGIAAAVLIIWLVSRWAFPSEGEHRPDFARRFGRVAALLVSVLATVLVLYLTARFAEMAGEFLKSQLGTFGFLGAFVSNLGEILYLLVALIAALAGGAAVSSLLSRLGTRIYLSLPRQGMLAANLLLGALAGAMIGGIVAAGLNWLYEYRDSRSVYLSLTLAGAVLGVLVAVLTRKRDAIPVGILVYTIIRTILNVLRAIEALIWVIIFVVWVGIGPFAGVLALTLHTIAALGKLYSEQVESILPGPLEAVKATGATRLQTIVYAVIPQIVPPYISFTIYRWDINVRMSTIIGFAGGGGIGFLLYQNINLLNYRAASAQMLSIAVVVALMDYFSAWLRNKIV